MNLVLLSVKLTLHLKSGGLHFLKNFYHLNILGWSSGFRAIDDLPRVHGDETRV